MISNRSALAGFREGRSHGIHAFSSGYQFSLATTLTSVTYKDATRAFQERFLIDALIANSGHMGKTASAIGMHRNTLTRTIQMFNINVHNIRSALRRAKREEQKVRRGLQHTVRLTSVE